LFLTAKKYVSNLFRKVYTLSVNRKLFRQSKPNGVGEAYAVFVEERRQSFTPEGNKGRHLGACPGRPIVYPASGRSRGRSHKNRTARGRRLFPRVLRPCPWTFELFRVAEPGKAQFVHRLRA